MTLDPTTIQRDNWWVFVLVWFFDTRISCVALAVLGLSLGTRLALNSPTSASQILGLKVCKGMCHGYHHPAKQMIVNGVSLLTNELKGQMPKGVLQLLLEE